MRDLIDIVSGNKSKIRLYEDDDFESKPIGTKEKGKFDFLNDLEGDLGSRSVSKKKTKTTPLSSPLGRKASGKKTRRSAANAGINMAAHPGAAEAMHGIMNSGLEDEISDEEARAMADFDRENEYDSDPFTAGTPTHLAIGNDTVPTNDNLPAIINKEIALSGNSVVPEWHQVKHLPGYMLNAIRAGGRAVFRQFTDTPLEEIQMICTFLNPESDVKAVMNWIRVNGVPEDSAKMTFGGGVEADVRLWKTDEFSFLLVSDFMGKYVYSWVGGRGVHVGSDNLKRLK